MHSIISIIFFSKPIAFSYTCELPLTYIPKLILKYIYLVHMQPFTFSSPIKTQSFSITSITTVPAPSTSVLTFSLNRSQKLSPSRMAKFIKLSSTLILALIGVSTLTALSNPSSPGNDVPEEFESRFPPNQNQPTVSFFKHN